MSTPAFKELKQAARSITATQTLLEAVAALSKNHTAIASWSLAKIVKELLKIDDDLGERERLIAVLACLQLREGRTLVEAAVNGGDAGLLREQEEAAAQSICDFAVKSICPITVAPEDEDEGYHPTVDDRARDVAKVAERCVPLAEAGLAIIKSLLTQQPHASSQDRSGTPVSPDALITAIAFADPELPWTTPGAARQAVEVLRAAIPQGAGEREAKAAFVAEDVLAGYLRPLFTKSRPAAVTASGRKAEFAEEPGAHGSLRNETRGAKPWKYADLRAIPVFSWAVMEFDKESMSQKWPLFTPVLLTLLDDGDTEVRSRGLRLLTTFLAKMDPKTLAVTGLDSVFQEAIFPTLLFLPSVTPESESLRLQEPAYEALLALSRTVCGDKGKPNAKLLDKVLRDGVFAAFFYARDHIRIVEVLVRQAGLIVDELRIYAVKHLKDLIPMIASIMEEPFAFAHPPSLLAAIGALQAVIRNCWPRLGQPPWREEVIKALVVCWLRAGDEEGDKEASGRVAAELARTASMMAAMTKAAGTDMAELVAPLTAKEPLLAGLFGGSGEGNRSGI